MGLGAFDLYMDPKQLVHSFVRTCCMAAVRKVPVAGQRALASFIQLSVEE